MAFDFTGHDLAVIIANDLARLSLETSPATLFDSLFSTWKETSKDLLLYINSTFPSLYPSDNLIVSNTLNANNLIANSIIAGNINLLTNYFNLIDDPTGFDLPQNVTVTYDSTARTITLTGTFQGYWKGVAIPGLTNGWVSPAHSVSPNTPLFLYYTGTTYTWSSSIWSFDQLQIAYVVYDSTSTFRLATRECHGVMPWTLHQELHQVIGTYLYSGGGLQWNSTIPSDSTATNRRPNIVAALIKDEDIITTNATLNNAGFNSSVYTQLYFSGAGATLNWVTGQTEIVPVTGSQPYWNQWTGSVWQQATMSNNSYMSVWLVGIPTSADAASQNFRFMWVQGQVNNSSLANEQATNFQSLNLASFTPFTPEIVCFQRVIIKYQGGNWTIREVDAITGTKASEISGSFNGITAVNSDYTLIGLGTVASPLGLSGVYDNPFTLNSSSNATGSFSLSGTANGTEIISMVNTTGILVGMSVTGTYIPAHATVTVVSAGVSITISLTASGSGATTLTFIPGALVVSAGGGYIAQDLYIGGKIGIGGVVRASTGYGTTGSVVTQGFTTSYVTGGYAPMINLGVGYYGIGYLQGTGGYQGVDSIAYHFGPASPDRTNAYFQVNSVGNIWMNGTNAPVTAGAVLNISKGVAYANLPAAVAYDVAIFSASDAPSIRIAEVNGSPVQLTIGMDNAQSGASMATTMGALKFWTSSALDTSGHAGAGGTLGMTISGTTVTATTFSGSLSGTATNATNVTGSGTISGTTTGGGSLTVSSASTVSSATQSSITTCSNLTTVGTVATGTWASLINASATLTSTEDHTTSANYYPLFTTLASTGTLKTSTGFTFNPSTVSLLVSGTNIYYTGSIGGINFGQSNPANGAVWATYIPISTTVNLNITGTHVVIWKMSGGSGMIILYTNGTGANNIMGTFSSSGATCTRANTGVAWSFTTGGTYPVYITVMTAG